MTQKEAANLMPSELSSFLGECRQSSAFHGAFATLTLRMPPMEANIGVEK
jgi:hypothetical protein